MGIVLGLLIFALVVGYKKYTCLKNELKSLRRWIFSNPDISVKAKYDLVETFRIE